MLTPQMTQTEVVGQVMQYVSDRLFMAKTFVRRDMAYAGRQERAFARGERSRREGRLEGDLQALKDIASGRQSLREVLRQCDEAVEAERQLDERIRQKANENENDNEKEV